MRIRKQRKAVLDSALTSNDGGKFLPDSPLQKPGVTVQRRTGGLRGFFLRGRRYPKVGQDESSHSHVSSEEEEDGNFLKSIETFTMTDEKGMNSPVELKTERLVPLPEKTHQTPSYTSVVETSAMEKAQESTSHYQYAPFGSDSPQGRDLDDDTLDDEYTDNFTVATPCTDDSSSIISKRRWLMFGIAQLDDSVRSVDSVLLSQPQECAGSHSDLMKIFHLIPVLCMGGCNASVVDTSVNSAELKKHEYQDASAVTPHSPKREGMPLSRKVQSTCKNETRNPSSDQSTREAGSRLNPEHRSNDIFTKPAMPDSSAVPKVTRKELAMNRGLSVVSWQRRGSSDVMNYGETDDEYRTRIFQSCEVNEHEEGVQPPPFMRADLEQNRQEALSNDSMECTNW